jgi:hypothetical protein
MPLHTHADTLTHFSYLSLSFYRTVCICLSVYLFIIYIYMLDLGCSVVRVTPSITAATPHKPVRVLVVAFSVATARFTPQLVPVELPRRGAPRLRVVIRGARVRERDHVLHRLLPIHAPHRRAFVAVVEALVDREGSFVLVIRNGAADGLGLHLTRDHQRSHNNQDNEEWHLDYYLLAHE